MDYNFQGLIRKIERIGISNLMGAPNALPISGAMYPRPALTSPMAQLTCLLPSNNTIPEEKEVAKKPQEIHPTTSLKPPSGFGVPAKPGSGALNTRLEQLNTRRQRRNGTAGTTRPDLGTVTTNKKPAQLEQQQSFVGTLSSLLFGRKGGLF